MGANCCVASKEKPLSYQSQIEVPTRRNIRYSPSWSFRWDNRTHIEDIMDNRPHFSHHRSRNVVSEIKSGADTETDGISDGDSPFDTFPMLKWRKSPVKAETPRNFEAAVADQSAGSSSCPEEKDSIRSAGIASASDTKPPFFVSTTPSSSAFRSDPSSSRCRSLPSDPTSSREEVQSTGYQLSRQVSDSRIPVLKSLNENNSPEGRQSYMLSVCSNDLSTGGSQCGSSDGWSMRTFSELVASSQRERWSFDSENQSSINSKTARPNALPSTSISPDLQPCGVCSKLLKEKASWTTQKIVASCELSVVAVLVCGHVYHAECLESVTLESDRFDPCCPVCTYGDKCGSKLLGKGDLKGRSKISRIATDGESDSSLSRHQKSAKGPRLGASSSGKGSFARPFLRRHFSLGSRPPPARSISESETSSRKKGSSFWARYRRE